MTKRLREDAHTTDTGRHAQRTDQHTDSNTEETHQARELTRHDTHDRRRQERTRSLLDATRFPLGSRKKPRGEVVLPFEDLELYQPSFLYAYESRRTFVLTYPTAVL